MTKTHAVKVAGLQKSYGTLQVLKDVSFSIGKGEILALLGPNGAGKTTTIKILATLINADEGTAHIHGYDVSNDADMVRASIGLTGQFAAVDEYLTGRENIEMIARLYHLESSQIKPRAQKLLERFDLMDAGDRPARTYSGGMKRRLDLAMSLVAEPPILFLDEPTTGLDPRSRLALWEFVQDLKSEGTTILLTTQYMEEAEYLADNIIVLDQGTIIAEGTSNELKTKAGAERIEITLKGDGSAKAAVKLLGKTARLNKSTEVVTIPAKQGARSLQSVMKKLQEAELIIDTIGLRKPTLDDVFLALTGHKADNNAPNPKTKKRKQS